ncbi:MAG TPA: NUDIX domain-containing protein [Candidatus Saccharimonadia bacterium]
MSRAPRFMLKACVFLVLRQDDQILMLRRVGTGYMDGQYSLVAGHLDGDERATTATVREAKEEAGITVDPADLTLVHTCHRLTRNDPGEERLDLYFECRRWQGTIRIAEPDKCDDLGWFPLAQPPANTIPIVHLCLQDIQAGRMYSEYDEEIQPA